MAGSFDQRGPAAKDVSSRPVRDAVRFSVNQGGQNPPAGSADLVNRFVSDLKTLYGYTVPGDPLGEFAKDTNSDKYFIRGDFNVAKGHQLTVRHANRLVLP